MSSTPAGWPITIQTAVLGALLATLIALVLLGCVLARNRDRRIQRRRTATSVSIDWSTTQIALPDGSRSMPIGEEPWRDAIAAADTEGARTTSASASTNTHHEAAPDQPLPCGWNDQTTTTIQLPR